MKHKSIITVVVLAVALGTAFLAVAQKKDPVRIRFVSLAWQTQAIAAVKQVLAAWNASNPNIQVDYQQVSWDDIQNYMTTSFEAKNVPDVFHFESTPIMEFATRGYLTDLSKLIPGEMKQDIASGAWKTVTDEKGGVYGIPFLWESLIILYNKDLINEAKIKLPTIQRPWNWDDLQKAAKALTKDKNGDGQTDQYGAAFGLRSPTNRILNLGLGFEGDFFYKEAGKWTMKVGDNEKALLKILYNMHHVDKTASLDGLTAATADLFTGFFAGKYAMLPGIGVWARQTIIESGPKNFKWGVLPPLKAKTQAQGSAHADALDPWQPRTASCRGDAIPFVLRQPRQQRQARRRRLALPDADILVARSAILERREWLEDLDRLRPLPDDGSVPANTRLQRDSHACPDPDLPAVPGQPPQPRGHGQTHRGGGQRHTGKVLQVVMIGAG